MGLPNGGVSKLNSEGRIWTADTAGMNRVLSPAELLRQSHELHYIFLVKACQSFYHKLLSLFIECFRLIKEYQSLIKE